MGTNGNPSTGIPYVLVNGKIAVRDSTVVDGAYLGQPIHYAVEDEGRFVPLERETYLDRILTGEVPHLDDETFPGSNR